MKVITTKTKQKSNKTARSPEEQRFDSAWQQVINQQKENEHFREDIQTFTKETINRLQEKERACMDTMYDATLHLIEFLNRKSLTLWQREALISWAGQYLDTMESNPFSSHLDLSVIFQRLKDALIAIYPPPPAEERLFDNDDTWQFEAEHTTAASDTNWDAANESESVFDEFFDEFHKYQQREAEQQQYEENQALKQLMKSSSINRLFRKIAAILHPDKESDAEKRAEKNSLMSELIQARNSNDIPRIFDFYAKYVGQSPLQELGEDLDSASELLERQLIDLLDSKENILREEPLTGILYHHFHKKTPAATQRAINKHLKELKAQHNVLQVICRDITSIKKLKPYLELRHDMLLQEKAHDNFF